MCHLKIKSVFYAKDRLNELETVPMLPNGDTDYWKASLLLCEKDGGRLPTMDELGQLASYVYGVNIPPYSDVNRLKTKQMPKELEGLGMPFYVWSSEEDSSYLAYYRYFSSGNTYYDDRNRYNSRPLAVCLGD